MPAAKVIKLLVAIVDRGRGSAVAEVLRSQQLPFEYVCVGNGTANSRVLEYLGLSETRKDVVFTFVPVQRVRPVMEAVNARLDLSHPGRGILFSVLLSGVSGQIHQALQGDAPQTQEENPMEAQAAYDLVVVVVEPDNVGVVMDAAQTAGARGGTVLHGRRANMEGGQDLLGIALEPEKEIVAMVVPHAQKLEIMRAVNKAAGVATPSRGLLFSLPVEDLMGLRPAPSEDVDPAGEDA